MSRSYEEDDIKKIYSYGSWHDWSNIVDWLKGSGGDKFAPGEVNELIRDFERLEDMNISFSRDWKKTYELLER